MVIRLIESGGRFSEENIGELKRFLSKIPNSHLKSLEQIDRVSYTPNYHEGIASSSPMGNGGEIKLPNRFYYIDEEEREFVFFHEMGHNYIDYTDFFENDRARLRFGSCKRENIKNLLRVQWMEIGRWELDKGNWEKVKEEYPSDHANKNKYTYLVKYSNPNHFMGEWKCPVEGRIEKNSIKCFEYEQPFYSPKEEMADAYAFFIIDKKSFEKQARKNEIIKKKYDFIAKCFSDNSKGKIDFERYNSC